MPTIVKMKYVRALLAKLPEFGDADDTTVAAALSKPTKAGERLEPISADDAKRQVPWQEAAQVQAEAVADAPKTAMAQLAAQAWTDRMDQFDFGAGDGSLLTALVDEGLLSAATRAKILAAATVDVPGPSWTQTLGLGQETLPNTAKMVAQVREYEGRSEREIQVELTGHLLLGYLGPIIGAAKRVEQVSGGATKAADLLTFEIVSGHETYLPFCTDKVHTYTGLTDQQAVDAVLAAMLDAVVANLQERET